MPRNILILGGTRDARDVATALVASGHTVTTSLAGVTEHPVLPVGHVRRGGFGGPEGLRQYLLEHSIDTLIDATHPFAAKISANAVAALQGLGITHFRFERPAWSPVAGDVWTSCASPQDAASKIPQGARILLSIGRKDVAPFLNLTGIIRAIEPPEITIPPHWHLILARPPFSLEDEISLLRDNAITHLVTKNAGGPQTEAKLQAARESKISVLMIERPVKQGGYAVSSIAEIKNRMTHTSHSRSGEREGLAQRYPHS